MRKNSFHFSAVFIKLCLFSHAEILRAKLARKRIPQSWLESRKSQPEVSFSLETGLYRMLVLPAWLNKGQYDSLCPNNALFAIVDRNRREKLTVPARFRDNNNSGFPHSGLLHTVPMGSLPVTCEKTMQLGLLHWKTLDWTKLATLVCPPELGNKEKNCSTRHGHWPTSAEAPGWVGDLPRRWKPCAQSCLRQQ